MSQTTIFHIPALDCPDELALLRRSLNGTPGIAQLLPDYLARNMRIEFDPAQTSPTDLLNVIQSAGFPAKIALPVLGGTMDSSETETPQGASRLAIGAGGVLLLAAVLVRLAMGDNKWPVAALAIASTLASGWPVLRTAYRAVRLRALDMNVLMTIAGIGAVAIGDFFEAATAMFLFGVSLWLERFSLRRAQTAIRSLLELAPQVAHRVTTPGANGTAGEGVEDVSPDQLSIGEQVLVRPGERIATDGVVLSGESAVNQAPITGESLPIEKKPGQRVFAGTLNGEGSLVVTVTKTAGDTTLANIERLIEDARTRRSPTERFVDAFARRYTPAIIALAIAVAIIPTLLGHFGVSWAAGIEPLQGLKRALVLLVIACPCALVISTPVTIVSALYRATQLGILVKGGEFLEKAAAVQMVALDKTGTLTTGSMEVVTVESFNGQSSDRVLEIAAALEVGSEHPLAAAIVAAAQRRGLSTAGSTTITTIRGLGVQGAVQGQTYFLGSARLFSEPRVQLAESDAMRLRSSAGGSSTNDGENNASYTSPAEALPTAALRQDSTVVWLGSANQLLGVIRLADRPRPGAQGAIAALRQLGIRRLIMLTGDNALAARSMAREIGIEEIEADLLPQDKIERIRSLSLEGPVAMVGDGVNDAPALAAADVGIALGGQASDTALETADVVVMAASLDKVVDLIRVGRRCRRLLKQNISFALASKLAVMLLAVAGFATMWMAVAADVGASMVVIANGLRMIRPTNRP